LHGDRPNWSRLGIDTQEKGEVLGRCLTTPTRSPSGARARAVETLSFLRGCRSSLPSPALPFPSSICNSISKALTDAARHASLADIGASSPKASQSRTTPQSPGKALPRSPGESALSNEALNRDLVAGRLAELTGLFRATQARGRNRMHGSRGGKQPKNPRARALQWNWRAGGRQ